MERKYTPGPWSVQESSLRRHGESRDTQICDITCGNNNQIIAEIPDYCFYDSEVENNKANARLIAAAPDLLQELRNIANADTAEWDDPREFEAWAKSRARAAIAKATGEST